ncbi:MAG: lamin tail domain-containing protein [Flavobacteriaceae bacterium]|jgi:hypothetical protein|nr:lamin tail domain-containing protein [Flavobacteriaceae bacterium]
MKRIYFLLAVTLTITMINAQTTLLSEDFSSITTGNNTTTSGSSTSWNGNANFPTVVAAYQAGGSVKLGSGSASGSITSKSLDLSTDGGDFKVEFDVKGWTTVEGTILVDVTGLSQQSYTYSAVMAGSFEHVSLTFTGGSANSTVKISTSDKRAFIDNVVVVTNVVPSAPPSCTTFISPENEGEIFTGNVTFSWNAAAGATSYKLIIGTFSGGQDVLQETLISGTTYTMPLAIGTYYANVTPTNSEGDAENCEDNEIEFTVIEQEWLGIVINEIYGGGGNTNAPWKNDFIELYNNSSSPKILTGAYIRQASGTGNFNATALPSPITIPAGGYYLIQADTSGNVGSDLPTPDFTISLNLGVGSGKIALTTDNATITSATGANVIDLVGWGTTANMYEGSGPAPGVSGNITSISRTNGIDTNDNAADFKTGTPIPTNSSASLDCTTFISPEDNGEVNVGDVTFSWNAVTGATGYKLKIGTASGNDDILSETLISGTTYTMSLAIGTYYANVTPTNGDIDAKNCEDNEIEFEVVNPPAPDCTTFIYPTNNATINAGDITFSWNAVAGATAYILKIGTFSGGNDVLPATPITETSTVVPLAVGTYYANVTPTNSGTDAENCEDSEILFTVVNPPAPDCTTFIYPTNNTTINAGNVTFSWNAATGATGYKLIIGSTSGDDDVLPETQVLETTYTTPLAVGTYYANVTPTNDGGDAENCEDKEIEFEVVTPPESAGEIIGWDANGVTGYGSSPFAPTTLAEHLTVTGLTRGSGLGTSGGLPQMLGEELLHHH